MFTLVLPLGSCGGGGGDGDEAEPDWNVVVVITDEQRWNTFPQMPLLYQRLTNSGIEFINTYVTTPVCAPFRASFYSGGNLTRDTHVLSNYSMNGNWKSFPEAGNLASQISSAGIRTGFVGKYMNGYSAMYNGQAPEIPPGWDYFIAEDIGRDPDINWYEQRYIEADTDMLPPGYERGHTFEYITDFQTNKALGFIDKYANEQFFLAVNYRANHGPATDAEQEPEDLTKFQGYQYRDRGWGEQDMSDKPTMVQEQFKNYIQTGGFDFRVRGHLRLLQSADRGVEEIFQRLADLAIADRTIVIFLSDNGFHWGEHNLIGKGKAFEEAARVPLAIFYPGRRPGFRSGLVAANLDVPATILDLLDLPVTGAGRSLIPMIRDWRRKARSEIYFENYELGDGVPFVWSALLRTTADSIWKLVDYQTGEGEFYDLLADPYELENAFSDPAYQAAIASLASDLDASKTLAILDRDLPVAQIGVPYQHQLSWWGDDLVPQFTLSSGSLPAGLQLGSPGLISGAPTEAGSFVIEITVTGDAVSLIDGAPYRHSSRLLLDVSE